MLSDKIVMNTDIVFCRNEKKKIVIKWNADFVNLENTKLYNCIQQYLQLLYTTE